MSFVASPIIAYSRRRSQKTGKPHRGSKIPALSLKHRARCPALQCIGSPDTDRQGPLRTAVDQFFSFSSRPWKMRKLVDVALEAERFNLH